MRRFGVPSSEFDGFMPVNGADLTGCPAKDNAKTPALRCRTAARRPPPKMKEAKCRIPKRWLRTKRLERMATGKELLCAIEDLRGCLNNLHGCLQSRPRQNRQVGCTP